MDFRLLLGGHLAFLDPKGASEKKKGSSHKRLFESLRLVLLIKTIKDSPKSELGSNNVWVGVRPRRLWLAYLAGVANITTNFA